MQTEVKPTIAWLWERLQDDLETSSVFSDAVKDRLGYVESIKSLRQQLVERCASVSDREGCYTEFVIRGNTLKAVIYLPNNSRFSGSRKDDANSAREMSAAYAFWAWELEQRKKEARDD